MLIVRATVDLPGEPKGKNHIIEPGARYHAVDTFTAPTVVTIHADGSGLVIVTVADRPSPDEPPPASPGA